MSGHINFLFKKKNYLFSFINLLDYHRTYIMDIIAYCLGDEHFRGTYKQKISAYECTDYHIAGTIRHAFKQKKLLFQISLISVLNKY
jgi:hypothetical protein